MRTTSASIEALKKAAARRQVLPSPEEARMNYRIQEVWENLFFNVPGIIELDIRAVSCGDRNAWIDIGCELLRLVGPGAECEDSRSPEALLVAFKVLLDRFDRADWIY